MAPEVMVLFGHKILHKDGYTRAIDFWSLGIMIYKLLTGLEAYIGIPQEAVQDAFPSHLTNFENYHEAHNAFFGVVDYNVCNGLLDINTRLLLQGRGLLHFNAENRLGYDVANMQFGFEALMNHAFFAIIDWPLLELKLLIPPFMPFDEILDEAENIPKTLSEILVVANKSRWCEEFKATSGLGSVNRPTMRIPTTDQEHFRNWHYVQSNSAAK